MQILALWYDSGTGFGGFTSKRVRQLPTSLEKFLSVPSLSILIKYFNLNSLHAVHANGTRERKRDLANVEKKMMIFALISLYGSRVFMLYAILNPFKNKKAIQFVTEKNELLQSSLLDCLPMHKKDDT